jgi:creatinine amidohydrolase/Fe(II)-dependent formamide hydrolase-like protein
MIEHPPFDRPMGEPASPTRRLSAIGPRVLRTLALVLFVAATGSHAAAPATVFLDELTSTELREDLKSGKTTIIIPVGGTEQNGPHMVLGKHNVRVKVLSERIAVALGNALVAPTVAYVPEGSVNPPSAHMRFPGTITLPDAAFDKLLEYAARSFRLHGFRDIVFLGDHGDYQKNLRSVAERLNREWAASPVRVHAIDEYYRTTETSYVQALRRQGFRDDEIGKHAGLADTSLALAVDPRLVRSDRLQGSEKPGSADGVTGDPRKATAALGQLGVDAIVAASVGAIRRATERR